MNTKCGCNTDAPSGKEYLMVEASASDPNQCGNPSSANAGTAGCAKQEPMFDQSLSDFLIPSAASSVIMSVCNGKVYTVGMWIQFVDPVAKLKISGIDGNTITLLNRNSNGDEVIANPAIATKIPKLAQFVVCDAPEDLSAEEELAKLETSLSGATQLCVPNLGASSSTAIVHPVGRVESDPENLSVKKCIKRIFGVLFNAGRPFLSALGTPVDINDLTDYRPLVKHKTTNGVYQRKNYSEASGLADDRQYVLAVTNNSEKLLGPAYLTKAVHELIEQKEPILTPASWPEMTDEHVKNFDISDYAGAMPPADHNLDHYYVMVNCEIAGNKDTGDIRVMRLELNDIIAGRCSISGDADAQDFNSITKIVKVMKSDNKLTLKLTAVGTIRFWYRLNIEAILY